MKNKIIDYEEIENMNEEEAKKYIENQNEALFPRVKTYLFTNPEATIQQLEHEFPHANPNTLTKYKSMVRKKEFSEEYIQSEIEEITEAVDKIRKYILKEDPKLEDKIDLFRALYDYKEDINK